MNTSILGNSDDELRLMLGEVDNSLKTGTVEENRPSTRSNLVLPVILMMAIGLLSTCGLVWLSAEVLNQKAEFTTKHLANSLISVNSSALRRLAVDYSWWGGATDDLLVDLDKSWVDEGTGSNLAEIYGITSSFVVDGRDRTVVGFLDGQESDLSYLDALTGEIMPLVNRARRAPLDRPVPSWGLVVVDNLLYLVVASAITPKNPGSAEAQAVARPVLVLSRALDSQMLNRAGREFALQGLRYAPEVAPDSTASLALIGPSGTRLGYLTWRDDKPGDDLLWRLLPALGLALLAMTYLLFIFFRSTDLVLERQAFLASSLRRERELRDLKSKFISMISHELRTPLATIRSAADMLDRYSDRLSAKDRADEIGAIRTAVTSLTRLLENVMVIGRSDTRSGILDDQSVDLGEICREIWTEVTRSLESSQNLKLVTDQRDLTIVADQSYLRALLSNLFQNAVKYSRQSDDVVVEIGEQRGKHVIRVVDRGIGVPAEEVEAVFQPFRRGSNASSVSGTGLGLTVARAAAESLGGTLKVTDTSTAGSTFEVVLPHKSGRRGSDLQERK